MNDINADNLLEELKLLVKPLIIKDIKILPNANLQDDLGLNSLKLMQFLVLIHKLFKIDLGRRSAELQKPLYTLEDIVYVLRME